MQGRLLLVPLKFNKGVFYHVNIYAPANRSKKNEFWEITLPDFIKHIKLNHRDMIVFSGDFNSYENYRLDRISESLRDPETAQYKPFNTFITKFNFVDSYRLLNPKEDDYTYTHSIKEMWSRLDSYLTLKRDECNIISCTIEHNPWVPSDHTRVELIININKLSTTNWTKNPTKTSKQQPRKRPLDQDPKNYLDFKTALAQDEELAQIQLDSSCRNWKN